jgi:acyl-CoA dehydrogenase
MGAFMSDLDGLLDDIFGTGSEHAGERTTDVIWPTLVEAGLTRVGIPEELGGSGGEYRDAAAIVTRAAEAGLSVPLAEAMFPVAHLARTAGAAVPPGIVTVAALGPGSWASGPAGFRICGDGVAVGWGELADELWAVASVGDARAGLARLRPGEWRARPGRNLVGEPRDAVAADATTAGENAWLLPAEILEATRLMAALGRSCQLLGALRACLRLSCEYALLRHQFGKPLAAHQVVRHAIARMVEEVAAAETAVSHAVGMLPESGAAGQALDAAAALAIAAAKVVTAGSATRVARVAHQLHGAVGLTAEHPLHFYSARLWAWRDECGSASYWSARISGTVHEAYHGDLWTALSAQGQASAN